MRSADGQKLVSSPLSRPMRAAREPGSVGGRFIAHGLTPATFQALPSPRKTAIAATSEPVPGKAWRAVRLSSSQRNLEYQARERPSGFTAGQRCSWCAAPFPTQPLYSFHRSVCEKRPGGPIPTGGLRGVGTPIQGTPCVCEDCGASFISRSQRREHLREKLCPMDARPSMCRKCGEWFSRVTDRQEHQNRYCNAEGAD